MLDEENVLCSFGGALRELKGIAGVPCLVTWFGGEGLVHSRASSSSMWCTLWFFWYGITVYPLSGNLFDTTLAYWPPKYECDVTLLLAGWRFKIVGKSLNLFPWMMGPNSVWIDLQGLQLLNNQVDFIFHQNPGNFISNFCPKTMGTYRCPEKNCKSQDLRR